MARRKWTLVLFVVCVCPFVCSRPSQEQPTPVVPSSISTDKPTENPNRNTSQKPSESTTLASLATMTNAPRDVKSKMPVLGEAIKMVTSQLLQNPSNSSVDTSIVADTRIPPKLKNQLANKNKVKTRNEDSEEKIENSHAGIAVPVTMEELESENKVIDTTNESSTSNEGISTWILLSNPTNKDNNNNLSTPTEPTKPEVTTKKTKPNISKNKTKRPQQNNNKNEKHKRPIIGSTNKSDLIAGGSAINENIFNKLKDTVLSNVQKNKNRTTTVTTTTVAPPTISLSTKKDVSTKAPSTIPIVKVTSKPTKKKNKNKHKTSTTPAPIINDSALLPMEPKEQEIELEVSTPPTTTKKPKRSSSKRKKNKTKRKPAKTNDDSDASETKISNKTKVSKPAKKTNPITTQIYNYLSREVMPSVGVGIVGLAGLVGLAGYFLYPFAAPVRRTFEVDKKDDIYRHNAEEYASEGNGQAEEEMLGTVLAGMPAHSKNKLNPYIAQTNHRYSSKKENDQNNIRYRNVATTYESPNYNVHYQQKTGLAHGVIYSEPANYNAQLQYENRNAYTTENKYPYETKNAYSYPAIEPIYAAPQTGPSAVSSYGSDTANAVVYGVTPTQDTEFKPVYPYEGQVYSETTSQPAMTYPPTSMYLGSNNESEQPDESQSLYSESSNTDVDNKFVVGNVPKELVDSVTPAVVPEHGPRKLNRRRRSAQIRKRSIVTSIEDILKAVKDDNRDIFLSNEIDQALGITTKNEISSVTEPIETGTTAAEFENTTPGSLDQKEKTNENEQITIYPVYAVSANKAMVDMKIPNTLQTIKEEVVESISTLPLQTKLNENLTTEPDVSNELEDTTKPFRVYEVFTSNSPSAANKEVPIMFSVETTTEAKNMNTETTTDAKSDTTTIPPSTSPVSITKGPTEPTLSSIKPSKPTFDPNVITYPPYNEDGSFFTFMKRLLEFKFRLGLSILQTTSDSLNRYLRSMEGTVQKMAKASQVKNNT